MPYQEIPSPAAEKARQNLEREWKKALTCEAEGALSLASESFGKVATGIVEWFPLTGADRKIKDDDGDAEDFNECLENYSMGHLPSCISGCASLLQNAPDLSYRLKVRVWCLQAVALVSPPSTCGHEEKLRVQPAIAALRRAYLGEAEAGRTMEAEQRQLPPLMPAPAPPPAPPPAAKAEKAPQAVPAPRGEICPTCHQRVEKLKSHKKKCPQRQVPCKLCKTHCSFETLEKHMRDECENRDVNCDKCDALMKFKDLNYHQLCQCECGLVRCQNDGCGWSGFRRSEADHRLKCLYLQVTCTHCLMELMQKEMPGHQCDSVDMSAPCSVCLESFSRLERKEIPPVMMLINNRRSCAHALCLKCAQSWFQRNSEQGLAPCPVCRAEYDSTTPFPDYLLQREPKRRRPGRMAPIRPPLPRQEQMKPGTQFFVSPLDVRFTHDSISECFRPYVKEDGEELTNLEHLKVLSSAKELLDGEEPKALEMLDVVWYQNNLYVAGTFNRRLCMYRLLALFATERFGLIKVQVKSQDELRQKFSKSLTTKCKGQVVKIRTQNNNSEEFQVGQSQEELHWPEAVEALGGGDLEEMSLSQSETEEELPSPVQTPASKPSDLDRVIAATAEFHRMPLDQVRQVLRQLNEEQSWLTCKRFRHDPEHHGGCPAIKRFEKYVQSCLSNGFQKWHFMDMDRDGCFEKILKASGVQNPGTISQSASGKSQGSSARLRSTDPGAPSAFPAPLGSRAACARSLSPRKATASRTFPEPPRPPSTAEGSAGAGAAGNSSVLETFLGEWEDSFGYHINVDWWAKAEKPGQLSVVLANRKTGHRKDLHIKVTGSGFTCGHFDLDAEKSSGERLVWLNTREAGKDSIWRKVTASRTFPEPPRPPSTAEGSAGAGAAGNSSVSFKAPPATFGTFGTASGRERSPGRSSVKAPPSCRERPLVKAPPPPPAPSSDGQVMELRQRLEEMQKRELERMNEKTGLLLRIQNLEEKNALLEDENASLLRQLSMEKEQHQQEVQDLQLSYDLVLQKLEEFQDTQGSRAAETTRPTPPPPSRRSRWAAKKEAAEEAVAAEATDQRDPWDPWWSGEDPWGKDPMAVDPGEAFEEFQDPWKSYDTAAGLNEEDIEHFAEHWQLEVNKVHEILAGLKTEEIQMVLRRFHVTKWKGSVEGLLWKYVESCRRNGFKKDHPTDTLVHFASSWEMPFDEVKDLLEKFSLEQQTQVITEFYYDDADYSDALNALRSYVGYLSDYDFQPPEKWEAFAKKWKIPAQDVAALFRRLEEEQVDVVVRRFVHKGYSKQVSASAQLKSYVRSCVANGFWAA